MRVVSRPPVREQALRALRAGVRLDDGLTPPARVTRVAPDTLELTIHEGRKRQIRRMCDHVGHPVVSLQRVRFGPLRLGDLPVGGVRLLTAAEVSLLRSAGPGSSRHPHPAGPRLALALVQHPVARQPRRRQRRGELRAGHVHRIAGAQDSDRELLNPSPGDLAPARRRGESAR